MSNELKINLEAELLYVEDNIAHFGLRMNGKLGEQTLKLDLNKFKEELASIE